MLTVQEGQLRTQSVRNGGGGGRCNLLPNQSLGRLANEDYVLRSNTRLVRAHRQRRTMLR